MSNTNERRCSIIVMGPSGVGKTTTAQGIANALGWKFAEADEFHPPENIAKMSKGIPLDDDDRAPWLAKIRDWITEHAHRGENTVLTCSALKRHYRDTLRGADTAVSFLELVIDQETVHERMSKRKGHYMPVSLLASQFASLEPLEEDEAGAKLPVDATPEIVIERALDVLGLSTAKI